MPPVSLEDFIGALDAAEPEDEADPVSRLFMELSAILDAKLAQAKRHERRFKTLLEERIKALRVLGETASLEGELPVQIKALTALIAKASAIKETAAGTADKAADAALELSYDCALEVAGLDDEAVQAIAGVALETLDKHLKTAALSADIDASLGNLKVFLGEGKLTDKQLLHGCKHALAGFKAALDNEAGSRERETLLAVGGKQFGDTLFAMETTREALGANRREMAISPAQGFALHRYTLDADYSAMNQFARELHGLSDERRRQAFKKANPRLALLNELCEEALLALPEYPEAAYPVYRIERAWSQEMLRGRYGPGVAFTTETLWSTGATEGADVSNKTDSPLFNHVIHGSSGRDIATLSAFPGEGDKSTGGVDKSLKGEVLFPPTAQFRVDARTATVNAELADSHVPKPLPGKLAKIRTTLTEL